MDLRVERAKIPAANAPSRITLKIYLAKMLYQKLQTGHDPKRHGSQNLQTLRKI